jgi:hypothetical protein
MFAPSTPGTLPSAAKQASKPLLLASRGADAASKAAAAAALMPPPQVPRKGSRSKAANCPLPSSLVNGLLASFTPLTFSPGAKVAAQEAVGRFFEQASSDLEA